MNLILWVLLCLFNLVFYFRINRWGTVFFVIIHVKINGDKIGPMVWLSFLVNEYDVGNELDYPEGFFN